MLNLLSESIYFLLPAYLANIFPVLLEKLKFPLGTPISTKYFGSHKTWRGFYAGYIGALIMLAIQLQFANQQIYSEFFGRLLNYQEINIFFYAFLFGIGAIFGDTVKSFFKRRLGIKPGRPFFPFDQLDFILGALLFLAPFYLPTWPHILAILIITPILHFFANLVAYSLKLKKVWW